MLKGGGSENVGAQYRLPDARINAGRDLQGVERAMIDAVLMPKVLGVLQVCLESVSVVIGLVRLWVRKSSCCVPLMM